MAWPYIYLSFVLHAIMANAAAWTYTHRIFFPNMMYLVMISWMMPAIPGLGLGVMELVSARAQGFQDAYQIGNLIVLPLVFLAVGRVSGVLSFSVTLVFLMGRVIWLGSRSFRRDRLLYA